MEKNFNLDLHPFFVHFPISLFLIALLLELIYNKINWIHSNIPLLIFISASISSIPSAISGNISANNVIKINGIQELLQSHELIGTIVTITGIFFSFMLIYLKLKFHSNKLSIMRKSIFLIMTIMVLYTGYLGNKMVQDFGARYNPLLEVKN